MPFRSVLRSRGRSNLFRMAAALALAAAFTASVPAQETTEAAPGNRANPGPAFALEVRAPRAVRELLERHLELRRYREVSDLDDAELARLIVMAERDARELTATLGFFDPRISVRREAGANGKPVIVVEVV